MNKKIYTPFLEWVDGQDNHEISHQEKEFIHGYVENVHNDVKGIWGYLLSYFDSIGVYINRASADVIEIQYGWETITDVKGVDTTRIGLQNEAVKKAFSIEILFIKK